jgi:adenylate cyclase
VTTRLASTLYGFEPDYEHVVSMLLTSGTQGLQLALLAPGWVHGCLGLWFRLRHYPLAQRMKLGLLAAAGLLPLLSAGGFIRMMRAVETTSASLRAPDPKLVTHQFALDAWRHNLVALYLCLVVGAFIAGQLRNGLERRRQRQTG